MMSMTRMCVLRARGLQVCAVRFSSGAYGAGTSSAAELTAHVFDEVECLLLYDRVLKLPGAFGAGTQERYRSLTDDDGRR